MRTDCAAASATRERSRAALSAAVVASATSVHGAQVGPAAQAFFKASIANSPNIQTFRPDMGIPYVSQFSRELLEQSWLARCIRASQGLPTLDCSSTYSRRVSIQRGVDFQVVFVFAGEILSGPTATADPNV